MTLAEWGCLVVGVFLCSGSAGMLVGCFINPRGGRA